MAAARIAVSTVVTPDLNRIVALSLTGGFFLLALCPHFEISNSRIMYNIVHIEGLLLRGGHRPIAWNELTAVHYSETSQNYVVPLNEEHDFTFKYLMSGYRSFLRTVEQGLGGGASTYRVDRYAKRGMVPSLIVSLPKTLGPQ